MYNKSVTRLSVVFVFHKTCVFSECEQMARGKKHTGPLTDRSYLTFTSGFLTIRLVH